MRTFFDSIKNNIATKIMDLNIEGLNFDLVYDSLGSAPDTKMGHVAFACFTLSKALRKSPAQIAKEIASQINTDQTIAKIEAQGPYINFFLTQSYLGDEVINKVIDKSIFKKQITSKTSKTMIEYSQPNTHKELHVGHMRNLCLGDALIRILRYCNYEVISSTFPGDVGTHVAKCLWYLKKYNTEEIPSKRKGAWLGAIYTKASLLLEDQIGTDLEDQNRKELTEILHQLEKKSGEYFDLWKETRNWSIDLMNEVYKWANVSFDQWYWESEVDSDSVNLIKSYYEDGLFVKDQGAIGIDLNEFGLGFCLLIKSDGNGLYATKDIELAKRKFTEQKIEKSIYIVDKRQAHHFKQVFKVLELMGFEHAKDCFHLQYDFVELPDGAMSSRKGNIVALQTLIDEMVEHVKTNYLAKYNDSWSEAEILQTANDVAKGAIKYGMIRMDTLKKIVFDMKEWLKLDGESGPYVQYAHARIHSLCEKQGYGETHSYNWNVLTHQSEIDLMLKISEFNTVAYNCAINYKTHPLTGYLYDLAKLFNSFYAECSIANAESNELKTARLALSKAVALTLEQGLSLLGIPAPKRM